MGHLQSFFVDAIERYWGKNWFPEVLRKRSAVQCFCDAIPCFAFIIPTFTNELLLDEIIHFLTWYFNQQTTQLIFIAPSLSPRFLFCPLRVIRNFFSHSLTYILSSVYTFPQSPSISTFYLDRFSK
jgi:hypothetical protein